MCETYSTTHEKSNDADPPLRALVEFVDGNLNRRPIVLPLAGSEETDEAMRRAILARWAD